MPHVCFVVQRQHLRRVGRYDFKKAHARVVNKASGALDQDATVTFSEMIEHSWYQVRAVHSVVVLRYVTHEWLAQGLNLVQIMFLHAVGFVDRQSPPLGDDTTTAHSNTAMLARGLLLVCVTAPWLTRGWFPVNPFSANYTRGQATTSIVSVLYRLKKYQYLLYKHVLLHGLNISVTLVRRHGTAAGLVGSSFFRLYWCCLNVSYVMEFFLQTLVKKRVMAQHTMLALQQPLMAVSTLAAAVVIIRHVHPVPCVLSLVLNLLHRKHDVVNTMVATAGGAAFVWWMDHGVAG